jgi:hypothetical protein
MDALREGPLHIAAQAGDTQRVARLLADGAVVDARKCRPLIDNECSSTRKPRSSAVSSMTTTAADHAPWRPLACCARTIGAHLQTIREDR